MKVADYGVALACREFQSFPVEYANVSATILDESILLKRSRTDRNS